MVFWAGSCADECPPNVVCDLTQAQIEERRHPDCSCGQLRRAVISRNCFARSHAIFQFPERRLALVPRDLRQSLSVPAGERACGGLDGLARRAATCLVSFGANFCSASDRTKRAVQARYPGRRRQDRVATTLSSPFPKASPACGVRYGLQSHTGWHDSESRLTKSRWSSSNRFWELNRNPNELGSRVYSYPAHHLGTASRQ